MKMTKLLVGSLWRNFIRTLIFQNGDEPRLANSCKNMSLFLTMQAMDLSDVRATISSNCQ